MWYFLLSFPFCVIFCFLIKTDAKFYYANLLENRWSHEYDIKTTNCGLHRYDFPVFRSSSAFNNDNNNNIDQEVPRDSINSLQIGLSCSSIINIDTSIFAAILRTVLSHNSSSSSSISDEVQSGIRTTTSSTGKLHQPPIVETDPYYDDVIIVKFQIQARTSFSKYAEYARLVYYFYALENNIPIGDPSTTENNSEPRMQIGINSLILQFNFGNAVYFQLPLNANKWIYEPIEDNGDEHNGMSISEVDKNQRLWDFDINKGKTTYTIQRDRFTGDSNDNDVETVESATTRYEQEATGTESSTTIDNSVTKYSLRRKNKEDSFIRVRSSNGGFAYFESIFGFAIPRDAYFPEGITLPFKVYLRWHDELLNKYIEGTTEYNDSVVDEKIKALPEWKSLQQVVKNFAVSIDTLELVHLVPSLKVDLDGRSYLKQPSLLVDNESDRVIIDLEDEMQNPCRLLGSSSAVLLNNLEVSDILQRFSRQLNEEQQIQQLVNGSSVQTTLSLPRIFCGIFTTRGKHDTNIAFIKQSWGRKCTGFLVFSTHEDLSIPAVVVDHSGEEAHANMWQKSVAIWKYIHAHYANEYDWFLLGGDDMYLIMENMYDYLNSDEIRSAQQERPGMYMGLTFTNPKNETYNSGGPGYLLDQKALKVVIQSWKNGECNILKEESAEDMMLGLCLRDNSIQQILPYNTSDSLNRHRFHLYEPGFLYTYIPLTDIESMMRIGYWQIYYDLELHDKRGFDCCSKQSISFHDITYEGLKEIHDYLFHCPQTKKDSYYELVGNKSFFNETREIASWGKRTTVAFNVSFSDDTTLSLTLK